MSLNRSKFLEPGELKDLRSSLSLSSRDHVLIILALETGARATEILNLRQSDLFSDTNSVFIKALKGGKDREIPIRPELMQALKIVIPFNIKYRRLEQIWRLHRKVNKKFHSMRHTFAINLYQKHRDIKLVQLALGHASPTSTAVYLDFVYAREQMQRILDVSTNL